MHRCCKVHVKHCTMQERCKVHVKHLGAVDREGQHYRGCGRHKRFLKGTSDGQGILYKHSADKHCCSVVAKAGRWIHAGDIMTGQQAFVCLSAGACACSKHQRHHKARTLLGKHSIWVYAQFMMVKCILRQCRHDNVLSRPNHLIRVAFAQHLLLFDWGRTSTCSW